MIVCPECDQFNPENNKFCQKCGTSLKEKSCHHCGEKVGFEVEYCPNCNAFTGTLWWAVVSKYEQPEEPQGMAQISSEVIENSLNEASVSKSDSSTATVIKVEDPEDLNYSESSLEPEISTLAPQIQVLTAALTPENINPQPTAITKLQWSENKEELNLEPQYLDSQKRYLLKTEANGESLKIIPVSSHALEKLFQVRVLDVRPLEKPRLQNVIDEREQKLREFEGLDEPLSTKSGIPAIALPYLALAEEFAPSIPPLQDAWQEEEQGVVLLPDRSQLPLFSDLWEEEKITIFQLIYYFDEMAALFKELSNLRCCQSVLLENNLRIDAEANLCLVQLYPDTPTNQPSLSDLGRTWQKLLEKSDLEPDFSLGSILEDLARDQIKTIKDLRFRLQSLANQQHQALIEQSSSLNLPSKETLDEPEQSPESTEGDELPTIVLPVRLLNLTEASATDLGNQRDHNEDYFGIETQANKQETPQGTKYSARGLYIICDGMGGHAAGEVASAMAVETLRRYFSTHWETELPTLEVIKQGIWLTNETIYRENQKNGTSGSGRMGTTLAMVLVQETKMAIAHVGDSRVYSFTRKNGIERLTLDHAVGQQSVLQGLAPELAYSRSDAYQLTQALGPRDNNYVEPEVQVMDLKEDTLLLICSDGLCDNDLIENHGEAFLPQLLSSKANLEVELKKLIDFANEHNGHDNITAIVIRIKVQANFDNKKVFM